LTTGVNILTTRKITPLDAAELMSTTIALRIGSLRKGRQLSFDDLAARSGVSKGMLVQIEQGRANPSIATLGKLAASLRVSVTDLITPAEETKSPVRVVAPGSMPVLWKGPKGGSALILVGSEGPDMLELWEMMLMPGERYEAKPHPSGTLELIHVTEGSLILEVAGTAHALIAGASAFARTDRPHAYVCGGRSRTRFMMVAYEPPSP
jgi:transcriptional regulator with XRE-family HTH domain